MSIGASILPSYSPLPYSVSTTTVASAPTATAATAESSTVWTGPRTVPPDGFTFVDAYPPPAGHWERARAGAPTQGSPIVNPSDPTQTTSTVTVRTHGADPTAAVITETPMLVMTQGEFADYGFVSNLLTDNGATRDQIDRIWKAPQNIYEGSPNFTVRDSNVFLTPGDALLARDAGLSPPQWWAKQWIRAIDAHAVVEEQAAKDKATTLTPTTLPTITPKPITPLIPPAKKQPQSSMNAALLAVGAALAIYIISKLV